MLPHGALISTEGSRCHPSEGLPLLSHGYGVLRLNMAAGETPGSWPRPPAPAASGSPAVHGQLGQGPGSRAFTCRIGGQPQGAQGACLCARAKLLGLFLGSGRDSLGPGEGGGNFATVESGSQLLLGRPRGSFVAGQAPWEPVGAESASLGRIPREFRAQGYQVECPLGSWGWPGSVSR